MSRRCGGKRGDDSVHDPGKRHGSDRNSETVNGEEFRRTYHLASSCFTLQDYDGKTRVTAKGIGHGLGMSQYTAKKMAEEGKSCEEILQYFFTDVSLEEVTDIVIEKNEKGE